jgi:tetratricopeptide (TPR) repeat protein
VYAHGGDLAAARAEGERAVAFYESLLADDPGNARFKMDLAMALHDVGEFASGLDDVPQALVRHRRAVTLVEELAAADPRDARAQVAVAYCANGLGESLARNGDAAGAVAQHARAARLSGAVLANDAANGYARRNRATAFELAGDALSLHARPPSTASALVEARGWYTRALEAWESMGRDHKLQGDDATAAVRIRRAIERCDAARASKASRRPPTP